MVKGGVFESVENDSPFTPFASMDINRGLYSNEWVVNSCREESDKVCSNLNSLFFIILYLIVLFLANTNF